MLKVGGRQIKKVAKKRIKDRGYKSRKRNLTNKTEVNVQIFADKESKTEI